MKRQVVCFCFGCYGDRGAVGWPNHLLTGVGGSSCVNGFIRPLPTCQGVGLFLMGHEWESGRGSGRKGQANIQR